MAQFPQELIEHIAFYADGETRRNMVTVSPSFQAAVERHVFDKISLKSKDLKRFQALYHEYWSYTVDDLEPDVFRVRPNDARIEPLLVAFARALGGCMPRVEAAEVFTFVGWAPRGEEEEEAGEVYGEEEVRRWRNGFVHRWGVGVEVGREGRKRVRWEVGGWRAGEDVGRVLRESLGEGVVEEVWVPFALRDRRREEEEGSGWD